MLSQWLYALFSVCTDARCLPCSDLAAGQITFCAGRALDMLTSGSTLCRASTRERALEALAAFLESASLAEDVLDRCFSLSRLLPDAARPLRPWVLPGTAAAQSLKQAGSVPNAKQPEALKVVSMVVQEGYAAAAVRAQRAQRRRRGGGSGGAGARAAGRHAGSGRCQREVEPRAQALDCCLYKNVLVRGVLVRGVQQGAHAVAVKRCLCRQVGGTRVHQQSRAPAANTPVAARVFSEARQSLNIDARVCSEAC